jgi:penicillin-binding protein 2
MKSTIWKTCMLIFILFISVTACKTDNSSTETAPVSPAPNNSTGPGDVVATVVSVPDPGETAKAYLDAWANGDHVAMYNMLTRLSMDAIRIEDFDTRYRDVTIEVVPTSIEYEILQTLTNPNIAQVGYQITLNSALVGPVTRETMMTMSMENGDWRVVWDDTLILPELAGGNKLSMESASPTRGIIYDKDGDVLASDTFAAAVSVIPSNIPENGGGGMLNQIYQLTGIPSGYFISEIFDEAAPWIIPITESPMAFFQVREPTLRNNYGDIFSWVEYFTHLAYLGEAGAHTIGWVGAIPKEDVDIWLDRGYPVDATIGRMGVESWGQEYLAGKIGGNLFVIDEAGIKVTRLAGRESEPSQSIYTSLDDDLQLWAQLAIRDFKGAVVVLERDTGRVLAMASSPTFNPNGADLANPNSNWGSYFDGTYDRPLFNRATMGQYPPGSIFKLVTMSAALESGLFNPFSSYLCEHYWYGPGGVELTDWTLDKDKPASGNLTLLEGLMRSCNPWFYQIGYTLYTNGQTTAVADMARSFGLGNPTGIKELPEAGGSIINPDDVASNEPWFNAVQQAIGQSETLITPLQAAVYIAAFGNGGTLYQPQLVERIVNTAGENTYEFEPIVNGTLPISENTLNAVREGLLMVITNTSGTAYRTFRGANYGIKVYGKTGTAQNSSGDPHAWFIGYTDQQRSDKPDIAVAVLVENIGDGSEFAAPIFRRAVDAYFYGSPQYSYPWESPRFEFDPEYFEPDDDGGGGGTP